VIGDLTPLMAFFWSRMCSDHPEWTGSPKAKQGVIDSSLINEIGKGSPKQCFERFMPELRALGFR
jgi:hypothetical protein